MELSQSIEELKGVGPALAKKFQKLSVRTLGDLLQHYPRRYDDFSEVSLIKKIKPGPISLKVKVSNARGRYVRRGLHITEAIASDSTGSVKLVWFNQPYRAAAIKPNEIYYISGNFELNRSKFQIMNPSLELVSDFPVHTARIVPRYPETKQLKSTEIRRAIKQALKVTKSMPEPLPGFVIKQNKLINLKEAYNKIHFPSSKADIQTAKYRLGFTEIFEVILAHLMSRQELTKLKAPKINFRQALAKKFVKHLPFNLTSSQRVAVWDIYQDIAKSKPMNRLIEGDVGSGKTVVAAMATVMTMEQGFQVAVMAPTEILAKQHAETFFKLLKPLGYENKVILLVGSMSKPQKAQAYQAIASGEAQCIIGTHALIQDKLDMPSLGLVVVDEQHRFGVEQRKQLLKKAGHMPHMLSMTATPIPRSLALSVYGDLDISILKEKPPGRQAIETQLINKDDRLEVYKKLKTKLDKDQMFVVCPLIDETDLISARSVTEVYKELSEKVFPDISVGLLHGRLKTEEKEAVMSDFVSGKYRVLVSTTVIEVGVDVPGATMMVIEGAERFGLAQIHQLRGRVGRNDKPGHCYLLLSDNKPASPRLKALERSQDGFKLAELDLELRGPGAIYGTLQHGDLDLRLVALTDSKLISAARKSAQACIKKEPNLLQYEQLRVRIQTLQKIVHLN